MSQSVTTPTDPKTIIALLLPWAVVGAHAKSATAGFKCVDIAGAYLEGIESPEQLVEQRYHKRLDFLEKDVERKAQQIELMQSHLFKFAELAMELCAMRKATGESDEKLYEKLEALYTSDGVVRFLSAGQRDRLQIRTESEAA